MGEYVIKLPDVGEGVAEAELVEWQVKVGDLVREDAVLAAVMTDKATVEIPSPVDGKVVWLGAEIGDTVAIGSPIVRLEVAGEGNVKAGDVPAVRAGKAGREGATGACARKERRTRACPQARGCCAKTCTGARAIGCTPCRGREAACPAGCTPARSRNRG